MGAERYSRNEALFGAAGQAGITACKVVICGLGGLGSHVAQQLAYLGVRDFGLVDFDVVTDSSLNRLIGAVDADAAAARSKVLVAKRLIAAVNPEAIVNVVEGEVDDAAVEPLVAGSDVVFGCLDRDLARLQLTALCARYARPYLDLASDTGGEREDVWFGGRVVFADGTRCLVCLGMLDQAEMARDSTDDRQREVDERIYGVERDALADTGPAVVSVNGAVASLAVTEFMAYVTGLRAPALHLIYYGHTQVIRRSVDEPAPDCYYCRGLWASTRAGGE